MVVANLNVEIVGGIYCFILCNYTNFLQKGINFLVAGICNVHTFLLFIVFKIFLGEGADEVSCKVVYIIGLLNRA